MIANPARSLDLPRQGCECSAPDPIRVIHMAGEVRRIHGHILQVEDQLVEQLAENRTALEIAEANYAYIAANPGFGLPECHHCRTSR